MMRRFKNAASGLWLGLKKDRSIRTQFGIAVLVLIFATPFCLSQLQWAILILTVFFVIGMEYVNSAIESFADRVHPEEHFAIKKTKDLAAAGVLLASICAVFVAILLFLSPIMNRTVGYCLLSIGSKL